LLTLKVSDVSINPGMLLDIIEDEVIKDLFNLAVIATIDGEDASKNIAGMVDALVKRLLALDLCLVLVPSLRLSIEQVDVVVGTARLDVRDVGA
jgi:hypothetical protein